MQTITLSSIYFSLLITFLDRIIQNSEIFSFFENVERITAPNYIPTVDDILCTRLETTKIVEASFTRKDMDFKYINIDSHSSIRNSVNAHF